MERSKADKQKDIIDLDLSATKKQRFRINGDNDRILELNTSDLSLLTRLNKLYPRLQKLGVDALKEFDAADEDTTLEFLSTTSASLIKIDTEMREIIDELFDAPVSEVCAPYGTMYDPVNGKLRFEHIIESLSQLYEENLQKEVSQISANISKHTDKYTKK